MNELGVLALASFPAHKCASRSNERKLRSLMNVGGLSINGAVPIERAALPAPRLLSGGAHGVDAPGVSCLQPIDSAASAIPAPSPL